MNIVVVADPIECLEPSMDTTLGLMASARRRGHRVQWCEGRDLAVVDGRAWARLRGAGDDCRPEWTDLAGADAVLLRTDPPVDPAYLEATFVLDFVDRAHTAVVNDPRGVRIANEKLWALQFPDLCPATLVAADAGLIGAFVTEHRTCVAKPIDGHAGRGVVRLSRCDPNLASLVEMLTNWGTRAVVVQAWLDEVAHGNKRIFMHASEPVAAVTRYPAAADFRIGLPAELADLTDRDHEICSRLAPELRHLGLVLVGLDVIGDHLIEVNVTSPGALRKSDVLLGTSLCEQFIDVLETINQRESP